MNQRKTKKYWKSLEERETGLGADQRAGDFNRFDGSLPVSLDDESPGSLNRRSFLKAAGFLFGSGVLNACSRAPGVSAIPHLVAPEEVVPGKALWYASTCWGCSAACGALVKVRDGRPVKLEGNPDHPLSKGGLCAVGQASILELYDSRRLKTALWKGAPASWADIDAKVMRGLSQARQSKRSALVLTGTVHSPSLKEAITRLLTTVPGSKHVMYDALSSSAVAEAHERSFGRRVIPSRRFDLAESIVSIDDDFLGAGMSPVEHASLWRLGRVPSGKPARMSYHLQFETRMSLTGANADRRVLLGPGEESLLAAHMAQALSRRAGSHLPYESLPSCPIEQKELEAAVERLWSTRGRSLVVCGTNDLSAQLAVNHANQLLGAYGKTLDLSTPCLQRQGSDAVLASALSELERGSFGVLIVHGCNPVAELPRPKSGWEKLFSRVDLSVSTASHIDETADLAAAVCPDHHFLESWGDSEPVRGTLSVTQPVIRPLAATRSVLESFAAWSGRPQPALESVKDTWRRSVHVGMNGGFEDFWARAVHDGVARRKSPPLPTGTFNAGAARSAPPVSPPKGAGTLSLLLYPKIAVLEGRHAQNPWLQEMPDPITKVVWDNYASISPNTAKRLGVSQGDVLKISVAGASAELPALIQPGQHDAVVAAALGYGRAGTERFFDIGPDWILGKSTVARGGRVGVNMSGFLSLVRGGLSYSIGNATVEKTGRTQPLACTQDYHSLHVPEHLAEHKGEERDIVRQTTLAQYVRSPSAGNPAAEPVTSLWPASLKSGDRRWAMAVDLSLCTGCSACVVACQAENNVAVVGKDEVARRRDMHWMRIDRYYADAESGVETVHQPMLCQQCGHAPCETVCPVIATAGSQDGLNQQVYNRCVGTRYCANNCPYKVRRFNWFEYRRQDALENMVLNPDVTVRSRGVMEKCSFCVQRIQEAKIAAKQRGEPLRDGEVKTACQQSCPTQAIVFGDGNDKASVVAGRMADPRRYRVLEELHVEPAVGYLTKVRNQSV